ncbi:MAG: T9SS type A sorting domain-containing protein [Muribaculaceae bacterium]
MRRLLTLIGICLALGGGTTAAMPGGTTADWEHVSAPSSVADPADNDHLDVSTADGYIYINTAKPVTIKVYTILGQLVSQAKVPAGISRLKLSTHGIYILKAGSVTRRVTI